MCKIVLAYLESEILFAHDSLWPAWHINLFSHITINKLRFSAMAIVNVGEQS